MKKCSKCSKCSKCKKLQYDADFSKNQVYCKDCMRDYQRERYNPKNARYLKAAVKPDTFACRKCKTEYAFTAEFFPVLRKNRWGISFTCRYCRRLKTSACASHHKSWAYIDERKKLVAMRNDPQAVCEVCGTRDTYGKAGLVIDHCHKTSKFRGLLCSPCNKALGLMDDDPMLIKQLSDYAAKFS